MAIPFPMLGGAHSAPLSDDDLVAALRAGDASAVPPFLDRFFPIALRMAVRYDRHNAHTLAWDGLSNLALEILEDRHRHARLEIPRSYIATAVKHHILAVSRRESRHIKRMMALHVLETAGSGQAVSQASYRAAHGGPFALENEAVPPMPLPPLAPAELRLMTWVGDGWTQQQIADELHIEREAAKKRIQRLRKRVQAEYATT